MLSIPQDAEAAPQKLKSVEFHRDRARTIVTDPDDHSCASDEASENEQQPSANSRSRDRPDRGKMIGWFVYLLVFRSAVVAIVLFCPAPHGGCHWSPRIASANNLRQLALSLNTYALDKGNGFPPACGGNGMHPGLSWRVAILPYMEEEELFSQFHLDEPWDSVHNRKLIPLMPKAFSISGVRDPEGQTRYRAIVGDFAAFATPVPGQDAPRGRRPQDFRSSPAKTVCIVEAADAVIWTKPDELEYGPGMALPRLSTHWNGSGPQFVRADALVESIRPDAEEEELRTLFSGGKK
jgi:hypothetical protein